MIASTRRSPSRSAICTIADSAGSNSPEAAPSRIIMLISASLTGTLLALGIGSSFSTSELTPDSTRSAGMAMMAKAVMKRASAIARRSGLPSAIRLGTSSPTITERKVIVTTTRPIAIGWA